MSPQLEGRTTSPASRLIGAVICVGAAGLILIGLVIWLIVRLSARRRRLAAP